MTRLVNIILSILIILVGISIVIKSLDYYHPDFTKGYLLDKKEAFNGTFKFALYGHIISTPMILLIGIWQVLYRTERKWIQFHRWTGKIYILMILLVGAPSGLIMALYAYGGAPGKVNFLILSIFWWISAWLGWKHIKKGNFIQHQQFMTRSFLLAISAVMLRIYSFIYHQYVPYSTEMAYAVIALLSWLPQIVIYEIYVRVSGRKQEL